jgi:hypothetical protein
MTFTDGKWATLSLQVHATGKTSNKWLLIAVLADRRQYLKLSEFEPDMDDKRCMCTDPIHDVKNLWLFIIDL